MPAAPHELLPDLWRRQGAEVDVFMAAALGDLALLAQVLDREPEAIKALRVLKAPEKKVVKQASAEARA